MLRSGFILLVSISLWMNCCSIGLAQEADGKTSIEKQAAQYRQLLEKSADELAKIGDDKAIEVIVELTYGRFQAKQESKEASAETSNLELQNYFDRLKTRYEEIRKIVNDGTRLIREEHADEPALCDRKILELIDSFKDERSTLRKNGKIAVELIKKAKGDLGLARDLVGSLERQKKQLARKLMFSSGASPNELVRLSRLQQSSFNFDTELLKRHHIDLAELGLESGSDSQASESKKATDKSRSVADELSEFDSDFDFN